MFKFSQALETLIREIFFRGHGVNLKQNASKRCFLTEQHMGIIIKHIKVYIALLKLLLKINQELLRSGCKRLFSNKSPRCFPFGRNAHRVYL